MKDKSQDRCDRVARRISTRVYVAFRVHPIVYSLGPQKQFRGVGPETLEFLGGGWVGWNIHIYLLARYRH